MIIKEARLEDVTQIISLYIGTVKYINSKDYSKEQIETWISTADRPEMWCKKIQKQYFLVAHFKNTIIGFSSIETDGYLDFMYVHKDHQGQGIASTLLKQIEKRGIEQENKVIYASVSKTAQPFFLSKNYVKADDWINAVGEIQFHNWRMEKKI